MGIILKASLPCSDIRCQFRFSGASKLLLKFFLYSVHCSSWHWWVGYSFTKFLVTFFLWCVLCKSIVDEHTPQKILKYTDKLQCITTLDWMTVLHSSTEKMIQISVESCYMCRFLYPYAAGNDYFYVIHIDNIPLIITWNLLNPKKQLWIMHFGN